MRRAGRTQSHPEEIQRLAHHPHAECRQASTVLERSNPSPFSIPENGYRNPATSFRIILNL